MRGGTWSSVKPILKVLNEHFPSAVHVVYIIKPENFWQKQRTSLGANKYHFEVIMGVAVKRCNGIPVQLFNNWMLLCADSQKVFIPVA